MAGTLYLVPTPIGNLGDISRRCTETLEAVDFIAAEDTRVTLKLLNHLGLKKPLLSYYRHNTGAGGEAVLERLLSGEDGALVTDAGTPAVSDPGEELVAQCAERDIPVVAIPGPCALVTALAVSGLPTGRFTFEGFLAMNKKNRRAHLAELAGERCALVTDAGTPAVSDPGEDLVRLCAQSGVEVVAIPGPCALVTALSVSGLPTGRFTFEGFLAMNRKNRRAHLAELAGERRTMIFYEAPHKLRATLDDLAAAFGPGRRISLCRELTKLHEEVRRTTLGEAAAWYEANPPRGEFVLVVEGAPETAAAAPAPEDALARVAELREQGLSLRDAVKQAAKETGLPKNELYDRAVGKHVEA